MLKRFWSKVDKSGDCWEWTASKLNGYGKFNVDGVIKTAHRVSWEIANGKIPDGMFVLHKCDNPSCVNHDHLFIGSKKDNTQDMLKKGRGNWQSGQQHHMAKLSDIQVRVIRSYYPTLTQTKLAEIFNCGITTIHQIVQNKSRRILSSS